jgi:hypothetical protein
LHQRFQLRKVFGTVFLHPGEQWPRIVQSGVNARMFFQQFNERQVGIRVRFFKHMFEIPARLVRVDQENEMERLGHGEGRFSSMYSTPVCK